MIIECINCNKKFNVNSELIPSHGRQIQCGSCNHIWHYQINDTTLKPVILVPDESFQISQVEKNQDNNDNAIISEDITSIISKKKKENTYNKIKKKKKSINISNFFSYLLVFVISFVSLLILLDTLRSPLVNIFPQLEIILFNLFETLKDVKLFIIDLT